MTRFRPCIDLHQGQVKQIVGGSLRDAGPGPTENFVASDPPASFARRYQADECLGGHVIKLGPGNDAAAREALAAWPGGLQIGGGIDLEQAPGWIEAGASAIIVTSWLFVDGALSMERVRALEQAVGRNHLVLDLSCRRVTDGGWRVATDRWQTITTTPIDTATLETLAAHCGEFLIHAADVEGLRGGIDEDLVRVLGRDCPIPCTYAGGARSLADLALVSELSNGSVDLTIGSALDLFGGDLPYADCVAWNRAH
ncbi:MAG: phosphoribosylformimino-5-aminoimidazole carboxamide ribotide isomerase [Planctomycetota bacterium]|jgi:phosphoribosylformimino-5-aminoimidazole carboxamide ribotide isomerase|nr:phosphoribosylformimino-5-aminoimidazole carboxamide ribotide isomerase [Planctomycetota bacterium]